MSKLTGSSSVFVDVAVTVKCCWEWSSGTDSDKSEDAAVIGRNRLRHRTGSSKEPLLTNDVAIA